MCNYLQYLLRSYRRFLEPILGITEYSDGRFEPTHQYLTQKSLLEPVRLCFSLLLVPCSEAVDLLLAAGASVSEEDWSCVLARSGPALLELFLRHRPVGGGPRGFCPGGPRGFCPGGPRGFCPGGHRGFCPGGHRGFCPGGHRGFCPGGHRGFSPGGHRGFSPGGHRGFCPGGHRWFCPRGHRGFSPGGPRGFSPGGRGPRGFCPGGHRGFCPGGHRGFCPGGPRGFSPEGRGPRGFCPRGHRGFCPGGPRGFCPGGHRWFSPGGHRWLWPFGGQRGAQTDGLRLLLAARAAEGGAGAGPAAAHTHAGPGPRRRAELPAGVRELVDSSSGSETGSGPEKSRRELGALRTFRLGPLPAPPLPAEDQDSAGGPAADEGRHRPAASPAPPTVALPHLQGRP
ncbi:ankyrin repeat and SOCS box protein 3 isoform 6-T6 [Menidia menidia]